MLQIVVKNDGLENGTYTFSRLQLPDLKMYHISDSTKWNYSLQIHDGGKVRYNLQLLLSMPLSETGGACSSSTH